MLVKVMAREEDADKEASIFGMSKVKLMRDQGI
jgi:hypothetical protein